MSHITTMQVEIHDLDDLKQACTNLGLQFIEGQTTYKWYGRFMGDWPLPEGVSKNELGRCVHAIRVPGATYEIGVVRKGNRWELLWDFYRAGGLEEIVGKGGKRLKEALAIVVGRKEARRLARQMEGSVKERKVGNKTLIEMEY